MPNARPLLPGKSLHVVLASRWKPFEVNAARLAIFLARVRVDGGNNCNVLSDSFRSREIGPACSLARSLDCFPQLPRGVAITAGTTTTPASTTVCALSTTANLITFQPLRSSAHPDKRSSVSCPQWQCYAFRRHLPTRLRVYAQCAL